MPVEELLLGVRRGGEVLNTLLDLGIRVDVDLGRPLDTGRVLLRPSDRLQPLDTGSRGSSLVVNG